MNQLTAYQTGSSRNTNGTETLLEAISIYAPSEDNNNPMAYAEYIANQLGVDINTPFNELNTFDLARAISSYESPDMYSILEQKGIFTSP